MPPAAPGRAGPGDPADPATRCRRRPAVPGQHDDSRSAAARVDPTRFSVSVYEILRCEYGIEPARAAETIELGAATDAQARILQVPVGAPLFDIRRLTVDTADRPIELSRDLFRADRTRISLERLGTNWKRAVRPR
ncbi:GntR family transcriptional regulator [Solwaraspora sp. WMMD937]|uniref:UTRA domain-containing protein n=1 Tax=Solwaraspora sp. WMMD937 TaxID=3016090 RepID=UPI00249C4D88|nr:GntR family transcriptional regulator [Solwaraspora sp. WMMD937]WFE20718.1 GntR family transcriptional regulator [Solwaraspora sp. WMMD937]